MTSPNQTLIMVNAELPMGFWAAAKRRLLPRSPPGAGSRPPQQNRPPAEQMGGVAIRSMGAFGLLLLEAPQRFRAVFVEGAIAARGRPEAAEAEAAPLHVVAHPLHLALHSLHLVLPAILMTPATHVRAPECEKEKCESDRPPEQEAENGRDDHAGVNAH